MFYGKDSSIYNLAFLLILLTVSLIDYIRTFRKQEEFDYLKAQEQKLQAAKRFSPPPQIELPGIGMQFVDAVVTHVSLVCLFLTDAA